MAPERAARRGGRRRRAAAPRGARPPRDRRRARDRRGRLAPQLANGADPAVTWPTGLVAPLMDEGAAHCADYVYVMASPSFALEAEAASLAGVTRHRVTRG